MSKTNREYSNEGVKGRSSGYQHWGCTPPFNKEAALPKNMNKPFLKRLVEWFTV